MQQQSAHLLDEGAHGDAGAQAIHDKEKLREDYILKMKKMKEVIAIAIMSIARVAHQLKEDPKVTPANAD